MLSLADSTVRLYNKRGRKVAYHLRSHLLVRTNVGFRLSAYLRSISCHLHIPGVDEFEFDSVAIDEDPMCDIALNMMCHHFRASAIRTAAPKRDTMATLRLEWHVSFTGHPSEAPETKELVVPLIRVRNSVPVRSNISLQADRER
jgi:hypothetical protein